VAHNFRPGDKVSLSAEKAAEGLKGHRFLVTLAGEEHLAEVTGEVRASGNIELKVVKRDV
jgi:hypothetical protein